MLRFRGFRASLNFSSGRKSGIDYFDDVPTVTMTGAYRQNTEFTENGSIPKTNKVITPSMVVLPPSSNPMPPRRSKTKDNVSKSTNDLTESNDTGTSNMPPISHSKSTTNVSLNPRGTEPYRDRDISTNTDVQKDSKKNKKAKTKELKQTDKETKNVDKEAKKADKELKKMEKEQKKLEKKEIEERKKRDKLEEKMRKDREKAEAQQRAKEQKAKKEKNKKKPATNQEIDLVIQQPLSNPLSQGPRNNTDTLKSSTSISSAPPPYSETSNDTIVRKGVIRKEVLNNKADKTEAAIRNEVINNKGDDTETIAIRTGAIRKEVIKNENDGTGNTSFGKPVGNTSGDSWDMITQHRQQINRTAKGGAKQKIMNDSQYVTGRPSIYI